MKNKAHGFTLIELMITLAIVGIAISVAVPSFRALVVDSRLSSQANDMLGAMKFTRSEAVKRNQRVTMCRSSSGSGCATAGAWSLGWIVFIDAGVVGEVNVGDELLQVHGALDESTVVGDGGVSAYVSYLGNGQTSAAAGGSQVGTISICGALSGTKRRKIDVTQGSGWVGVRTVAASATCTAT